MQPIITSNIKEHIPAAIQKRPSGHSFATTKAEANDQKESSAFHQEDIIDLSTAQTSPQSPSRIIKNSTPVTNEERSALLDSFSDKKSFSIYF